MTSVPVLWQPRDVTRQDLQTKKREWRRRADAAWWRPVAHAGLDAVTAVEVLGVRAVDRVMGRPGPVDVAAVTAVIKTFERPRQLRTLVASIRRLYPDMRVIVADDSRRPSTLLGVETIALPFNSGVSAGRRAAAERVETPFVLTLDDDFVLTRHSALSAPLAVLEANPIIDICGGTVVNLPDFAVHDYSKEPLYPGAEPPVMPWGSRIGDMTVMAKIPNFYLGRTERIRLVGWSDELKFFDHRDFFTRASGTLVSVQHPSWSVLHARNPFDRASPARVANDISAQAIIAQRYYSGR